MSINNASIKPGYRTSEAWVSLLSSIFVMVSMPAEQAATLIGGISAVYTVGRSIVKSLQNRS
jgi:hypothetical protein